MWQCRLFRHQVLQIFTGTYSVFINVYFGPIKPASDRLVRDISLWITNVNLIEEISRKSWGSHQNSASTNKEKLISPDITRVRSIVVHVLIRVTRPPVYQPESSSPSPLCTIIKVQCTPCSRQIRQNCTRFWHYQSSKDKSTLFYLKSLKNTLDSGYLLLQRLQAQPIAVSSSDPELASSSSCLQVNANKPGRLSPPGQLWKGELGAEPDLLGE